VKKAQTCTKLLQENQKRRVNQKLVLTNAKYQMQLFKKQTDFFEQMIADNINRALVRKRNKMDTISSLILQGMESVAIKSEEANTNLLDFVKDEPPGNQNPDCDQPLASIECKNESAAGTLQKVKKLKVKFNGWKNESMQGCEEREKFIEKMIEKIKEIHRYIHENAEKFFAGGSEEDCRLCKSEEFRC